MRRRKHHQAAPARGEFPKAALDALPALLIYLDRSGTVLAVNDAWNRRFAVFDFDVEVAEGVHALDLLAMLERRGVEGVGEARTEYLAVAGGGQFPRAAILGIPGDLDRTAFRVAFNPVAEPTGGMLISVLPLTTAPDGRRHLFAGDSLDPATGTLREGAWAEQLGRTLTNFPPLGSVGVAVVEIDGFDELVASLGDRYAHEVLWTVTTRVADAAGPEAWEVRLAKSTVAVTVSGVLDGGRNLLQALTRALDTQVFAGRNVVQVAYRLGWAATTLTHDLPARLVSAARASAAIEQPNLSGPKFQLMEDWAAANLHRRDPNLHRTN